jgi:hypothetical protein
MICKEEIGRVEEKRKIRKRKNEKEKRRKQKWNKTRDRQIENSPKWKRKKR